MKGLGVYVKQCPDFTHNIISVAIKGKTVSFKLFLFSVNLLNSPASSNTKKLVATKTCAARGTKKTTEYAKVGDSNCKCSMSERIDVCLKLHLQLI